MNTLGARIAQLRRERKITQQELALHAGVSKAAVSKWERGQAWPDVALLPVLASYFHVTLDSLMAYKPRLTREELRAEHTRLTRLFANAPLEEALEAMREVIHAYYADASVLIEGATLLINHAPQTRHLEEAQKLLERARQIGTLREARQASYLQAVCLMTLSRLDEAETLLEEMCDEPLEGDVLLAQVYAQGGKNKEAAEQVQWAAYTALISLISALGLWGVLQKERAGEQAHRIKALEALFSLEALCPISALTAYVYCAMGQAQAGDIPGALSTLEEYVRVAMWENIQPVLLHAHMPFDAINARLDALPLGRLPPVDESLVRERLLKSVTENPAFTSLEGDPRFQALVRTLRIQLGK